MLIGVFHCEGGCREADYKASQPKWFWTANSAVFVGTSLNLMCVRESYLHAGCWVTAFTWELLSSYPIQWAAGQCGWGQGWVGQGLGGASLGASQWLA